MSAYNPLLKNYHSRKNPYQIYLIASLVLFFILPFRAEGQRNGFTMEEVMSYPFSSELSVAATGSRIAWAFNESGLRNIYVAEGPQFESRQLTQYLIDDGQAISSLSLSTDGKWIVYIRGGDFGSNWDDALPVNPMFSPEPPKVQIWSITFEGGEPILLCDGENPVISPQSDRVAFVKSGQIWTVPVDGSSPAEKLFTARGRNGSPQWSPDGNLLAFQSNRQDHAFIGIFRDKESPILWIDPSFNQDSSPRWSPDGTQIAFIRTPGRGGAPDSILTASHYPWMIMTASAQDGKAGQVWKAPETIRGSVPSTHGGTNLHWAAKNRIVFLSYHDGWPHLYSITEEGGEPLLLTPGSYMAEYIHLSADRNWLVFAGNTGIDPKDMDRRHIIRVAVDKNVTEVMTPGDGLEWTPVITGDGEHLVYLSATAQRPPLPAVMNIGNRRTRLLAEDRIPENFPTKQLVTPEQVVFKSTDGLLVHATLFRSAGGPKKKPAVVYVHGGPPRQMLLGWHYSSYYSNAYAVNQYLASRGFVVLSVNYRLGIGYGYEFHRPVDGGTRGASEYKDVKAAGQWLASQDFVDAGNIGIYGGSYGGYLTAMALGRDSELFAAGVDIHGVHDRTQGRVQSLILPDQYEKAPDAELALEVAWQSSPVSSVDTWTSPVLIIHGDDDRNVQFSESTDLVQRLLKKGVHTETMVIVDDTHHFMRFQNQLKVNLAIADFLTRWLL